MPAPEQRRAVIEISNKDFGGLYSEAPAGCRYVQVGAVGRQKLSGVQWTLGGWKLGAGLGGGAVAVEADL